MCGDFSIHNHTTLQAEIKHKAGRERGKKGQESTVRSRGCGKKDTIPLKMSPLRKEREKRKKSPVSVSLGRGTEAGARG